MDDTKLTALLGENAPPAHDPAFVLAVMSRLEQRRFRRAMLANVTLGLSATLLLGLMAPSLEIIGQQISLPLPSNQMIAALLLAGIALMVPWMTRRS